jgi:hypothetical protein
MAQARECRVYGVASLVWALPALAAGLSLSCGGEPEKEVRYCQTTREYFIESVWEPIVSKKCIECHTPYGAAKDSRLVLAPSTEPGFADKNMAVMAEVSSYTIGGLSALLLKPTAQKEHGGGQQITAGSPEYEALSELVHRFSEGEACTSLPVALRFPGLALRSYPATLYKASLRLVGRLPTPAEMNKAAEGEVAFDEVLDAMMTEPAFADGIKQIVQDEHLFAPQVVDEEDFPNILSYPPEAVYDVMKAVGGEPLDLVAYIVRNNLPITELLTADYAVVNPTTAHVYGVEDKVSFKDPTDPTELAVVQLSLGGEAVEIPHAGVLTTPSFLRFYSPGIRQRHRADVVFRRFLGTDLSLLGGGSFDVAWTPNDFNPTVNNQGCKACHAELDAAAGTFLSFSASGRYMPTAKSWYQEMPPPGFGGVEVPKDELNRGAQILAQAVAKDPRFLFTLAHTFYRGIVGQDPLAYPTDGEAPDHAAKLRAFLVQDTFFREAVRELAASGHNIKTLIRAIVKSPYYRAISVAGVAPEKQADLIGLGSMRLLPPELLDKKILATTGSDKWSARIGEEYHYHYALGGAGSRYWVLEREERQSGFMAALAERIAHETSCDSAAVDFARAPGDRLLFPHVEVTDMPEGEGGAPVPASVLAIKKNIRHLHERLFGEILPEGDPEIERTFELFVDTWREGRTGLASGDVEKELAWACRTVNVNPAVPVDHDIAEDPQFTIRAWMAVLKAMLSDPFFLYE